MRDACVIALSTTTIRVMDRGGTSVVEVTGEIDMVSGGSLLAILTTQLDEHPEGLVVDLTRTTFFTSTGINVLVDTAIQARDRGVVMVVAASQPAVLRPLRVTGVDDVLNIQPTVDLALTALQLGRASSFG